LALAAGGLSCGLAFRQKPLVVCVEALPQAFEVVDIGKRGGASLNHLVDLGRGEGGDIRIDLERRGAAFTWLTKMLA
jgi:hypothetical protein